MTRLRAAFVAASAAWAVLLVLAPFLASRPHASTLASALIVGVYGFGSLICHQLPERSYQLWTAQMPVCARCAGIYFGAVAGAIASAFRAADAVRRGGSDARHPPSFVAQGFSPARVALALAAAPTLATLVYEWTTGDMPSNAIRAAAGVPIGLVVAWVVVAAADNQVN
jgi:hypothetical protein